MRLVRKVRPMFHGRVLQVTEDILLKWRLLVEEGRKTGTLSLSPICSLRRRQFTTA